MILHILTTASLALTSLATAVVGSREPLIPGTAVNTTSGPVIGHAATNRTLVVEYLGIPYAQPPTGDLRFLPPLAYESLAVFNASSYVCPDPIS